MTRTATTTTTTTTTITTTTNDDHNNNNNNNKNNNESIVYWSVAAQGNLKETKLTNTSHPAATAGARRHTTKTTDKTTVHLTTGMSSSIYESLASGR